MGLIEAARRAGIAPAVNAANSSDIVARASAVESHDFTANS
jgi:hypothetical protein